MCCELKGSVVIGIYKQRDHNNGRLNAWYLNLNLNLSLSLHKIIILILFCAVNIIFYINFTLYLYVKWSFKINIKFCNFYLVRW